ncbi:MAG: M50 family metallopeptidase, partial [Thermoleophilia bacterium]|nr:M50 family metallopeptidase [Thermoleophilia bacterium]
YQAPRRLTALQSNLISAAGPAIEIVLAIPLLIVTQRLFAGADTLDQRQSAYEMYQAIAWAGILLGVTNLAPLWPLDGGHIAERVLTSLFGERAQRPFAIWSVIAAGGLLVTALLSDRIPYVDNAMSTMQRGVIEPAPQAIWAIVQAAPAFLLQVLFIPLFCLLGAGQRVAQLNRAQQLVTAENVPTRREMAHADAVTATKQAERASWASNALAPFPSGWTPSPWVRAHVDLVAGRQAAAVADLADLADDRHRRWLLDRADRSEIGHLLTLVPPNAADSLAVLEARVHHGAPEDLVAQATRVFLSEQSAEPLYLGAAGLAVRGLDDEAMQWLRRAVNVAPDPQRMSIDREFHRLHRRSD